MPRRDYVLTVEDKQVLKAITHISKELRNMEKSGDRAMKNVSNKGKALGGVITGAVGGAVQSLTNAVLRLGVEAVRAFGMIIKGAVDSAAQMEVTERQFVAMFEGNEAAATAVMDRLRKRALELGLGVGEALSFGKSLIPDLRGVEDPIKQMEKALLGFRGLATQDPVQGELGARIAMDEAMAGSLNSLKLRFEFTKTELDLLREAQKEMGTVVGAIEGVNEVLARRGFTMESIQGTFVQTSAEMMAGMSELQLMMGEPITDELTQSMERMQGLMRENSGEAQLLAGELGDLVAIIVDFLSDKVFEFAESLDFAQLRKMTVSFQELINQALVFADILLGLEVPGDFLGTVTAIIDKLTEAMETLNKVIAMTNAVGDAVSAFAGVSQKPIEITGTTTVGGLPLPTFGINEDFLNFSKASAEAQDAFKESLLESVGAMEEGDRRMEESNEATKERIRLSKEGTEAGLAEAEALLAQGGSLNELSEAEGKRLKLAAKFSQQREDIARKGLQRIDDIHRKHRQSIKDLEGDIGQEAVELALKQADARVDLARRNRQRMIDIEQDYRREISNIATDLAHDKEDAEQAQDAIAFVNAIKRAERRREEAGVSRIESNEEAMESAGRAEEELKVRQERERAAQQLADAQRLADLQAALALQLAEEEISNQRRLDEQAIAEERKVAALEEGKAAATDVEKAGQEERYNVLDSALRQQVDAVKTAEDKKIAIIEESLKRQAILQAQMLGGTTSRTGRVGASPRRPRGRQRGGPVRANQPYIVGELEPELFVPKQAGTVHPSLADFPVGEGGGGSSITNTNISSNFELNNPALLTPEQAAMTRNIAEQMAFKVVDRVMQGR